MPGPVPPWRTPSGILKRVFQLSSLTSNTKISPAPLGGRTFMCLPQHIRFRVYELLLSSSEPIQRPWPERKFTMQLLRVSKDVFAEAACCFYGKADDGRDMDDEIDLMASHNGNETVYMTPHLPPVHENTFQPMMNFATQELDLPPFPYRALVMHIIISPCIPWTQSTLDAIGHYPHLATLTITVHSPTTIFPYNSVSSKYCVRDIHDQNARNGHFISNCVTTLDGEGTDMVEVFVEQVIMQRPDVRSNRGYPSLEDWDEEPDEVFGRVVWDVTVDERRVLRLRARD